MAFANNEDYEGALKLVDEIRVRNGVFLEEFKKDLEKAGLVKKTITRHINNIDLYINDYLLREEPLEMREGTSSANLDDFISYFFIRKCLWSTPATIKTTTASIKKFYKYMLERGRIDQADYIELTSTIKEMSEEWMEMCRQYNDPDGEDPFSIF
ncbi:MAG: recombinase [Clostridium sp.]|nr:recombinase [Clostridium sp.]